MTKLQTALERSWVKPNALTWALLPFSVCYGALTKARRKLYDAGLLAKYKAPVPVIVVGNLTVGGTGKTPLVIYLVKALQAGGFKPAVISRGYRSSASSYPFLVCADTAVADSGDEPALIARRTGVPVMIGADRQASIEQLMKSVEVDVIVSDDGLQHLALQRDIEICVSNQALEEGNTLALPAGPYREPLERLQQCDFLVSTEAKSGANTYQMTLVAEAPLPLAPDADAEFDVSAGLHMVSGIGSPERFFATCESLGYRGERHIFSDHHDFKLKDIEFDDQLPVLMTEKDAVKCEDFASARHWMLPVSVKLEPDLGGAVIARLNNLKQNND